MNYSQISDNFCKFLYFLISKDYWWWKHWINWVCIWVIIVWIVVSYRVREKNIFTHTKIIANHIPSYMWYVVITQTATRIWRIFLCNIFWGMIQRKQTLAMLTNEWAVSSISRSHIFFDITYSISPNLAFPEHDAAATYENKLQKLIRGKMKM